MSIHLKVLGFISAVALLGAPVPDVAAGDVVYSSWDTTLPGGEIKGFMHDTVSISDSGEVAILARVKPPKPDRMKECILVGSVGGGAPEEVVCTGGAYDNIEQPQISADGSYVSWVGREGGTSGIYYTDVGPNTTTNCVREGDAIAGYPDPIANILSGRVVDDNTCKTVFLAVLPSGQQVLAQGGSSPFTRIADADHGSANPPPFSDYDSFVGNISVTTAGVAYEVRAGGTQLPEIYQALAPAYAPALVADTTNYDRFIGAPVMSAGPNQGVCFLARMASRATELHCCAGGNNPISCGLAVPDAFNCAGFDGKASQIKDFDVSNGVGGNNYLVLQTSRAVCGCANPYDGACTLPLDNLLAKGDAVIVPAPTGGIADVRIFRPGVAVQPSADDESDSVASNGNARHQAKQKPRTAKAVFVTP